MRGSYPIAWKCVCYWKWLHYFIWVTIVHTRIFFILKVLVVWKLLICTKWGVEDTILGQACLCQALTCTAEILVQISGIEEVGIKKHVPFGLKAYVLFLVVQKQFQFCYVFTSQQTSTCQKQSQVHVKNRTTRRTCEICSKLST